MNFDDFTQQMLSGTYRGEPTMDNTSDPMMLERLRQMKAQRDRKRLEMIKRSQALRAAREGNLDKAYGLMNAGAVMNGVRPDAQATALSQPKIDEVAQRNSIDEANIQSAEKDEDRISKFVQEAYDNTVAIQKEDYDRNRDTINDNYRQELLDRQDRQKPAGRYQFETFVDPETGKRYTQRVHTTKGTIEIIDDATGQVADPSVSSRLQPIAKTAEGKEHQVKAGGFADRMKAAHDQIVNLRGAGYSPETFGTGLKDGIAGETPFVGNWIKSEEGQQFKRAKMDFITAVLRKESGAAIGQDEYEREEDKYFPQWGDDPATIEAKRIARERAIATMEQASGGHMPNTSNIQTPDRVIGVDRRTGKKVYERADGSRYTME